MFTYKRPISNKSVIKKRKAKVEGDWLTCGCGNNAMHYGFFEVTAYGNPSQIQDGSQKTHSFGCFWCGAIIKTPKDFPFVSHETTVSVAITKFVNKKTLAEVNDAAAIGTKWFSPLNSRVRLSKNWRTEKPAKKAKRGKTGKKRNRNK